MKHHRARTVQTLTGPTPYIDSGWTEYEWALIRTAMAKRDDRMRHGKAPKTRRAKHSKPAPWKPQRRSSSPTQQRLF